MTRGRKALDDSDAMAMFRLQYTGPGALEPLENDEMLSSQEKHDLLFHKYWLALAVSSRKQFMTYLRRWKRWVDSQPRLPFGCLVHPSSKVSAFLQALLQDLIGNNCKDPAGSIKCAGKALRHLSMVQRVPEEDSLPLPKQPLIAGVKSMAREATTEARRGEDQDPSCSSTTLSREEKAALLDAAMRFPDTQVGLTVAAMLSVALLTGFRSDDLCDAKYFLELMPSAPASPWPMQILGIAHNGGKANQEGLVTYGALASNKDALSDSLTYLGQHLIFQLHSGLPLLKLISEGNTSWRSLRMFMRDPASASEKQTYYDLASQLQKVVDTLSEPLLKSKLMHLMRCTGLVDLAANAVPVDVLKIWGRWYKVDGTVGVSYLPKSPLSALPATGVLCGFGPNFMTAHAVGRSLVAVPVAWIDALAPNARKTFRTVRVRNRAGIGRLDKSGENAAGAILRLAEAVWQSSPFMLQRYGLRWWALQLPSVRGIIGSRKYRLFEQEVISEELKWSASSPLSPELKKAFEDLQQRVTGISEQLAQLQESVDGLKRSADPRAGTEEPSPKRQQHSGGSVQLPKLDAGVGLSANLVTVQDAVKEWFQGFNGFPTPETLREQVVQCGQRVGKKFVNQLSRRRHLPLRIQALAKDRKWPLCKAIRVYNLVAQRHELSLAELRDGARLISPVRNPTARGGFQATSDFISRSPLKRPVSVAEFGLGPGCDQRNCAAVMSLE